MEGCWVKWIPMFLHLACSLSDINQAMIPQVRALSTPQMQQRALSEESLYFGSPNPEDITTTKARNSYSVLLHKT